MFEIALVALAFSQPSLDAIAEFERSVDVYRSAGALVDELSYVVEMPGADPHRDSIDIVIGTGQEMMTTGDLEFIRDGADFYIAIETEGGPYIRVDSAHGFVESLANATGNTVRIPAPPHMYMRDGVSTQEALSSFGYGIASGMELVGVHDGSFENADVRVFEVSMDNGQMQLYVDPETSFFVGAEMSMTSGAGNTPGISAQMWFETKIVESDSISIHLDVDTRSRVESVNQLMWVGPVVGQQVSDLQLARPDGSVFRLSELDSSFIVLDFWATWCGNCMASLPELDRVANWSKDAGVDATFIAVNAREHTQGDERARATKKWWDSLGIDLDRAMDIDDQAVEELHIGSFPQLLILDENHKVVYAHAGFDTNLEEHLRAIFSGSIED